jgi:hypothetical protein
MTPVGEKLLERINPGKVVDLMKVRFAINDEGLRVNITEDWKSIHGFVHTGTQQLKNRLRAVRLKKYPYEPAIAALIISSYYVMLGSAYVSVSTKNLDTGISIVKAHDLLRSRVEIVQVGEKN